MSDNPFADKEYDRLPSIRVIYDKARDPFGHQNIILLNMFCESVPLILHKYHRDVIDKLPDYGPMYEIQSNYSGFHSLTRPTFEEVLESQHEFKLQKPNYKRFMVEQFYRSRKREGQMDICDAFYQDLFLLYWGDKDQWKNQLRND